MIEIVSHCLEDTLALGRKLGQLARPGDIIGLDGQLGAGKTQLVRGLAAGLGLDPTQVSSPTFVIMHEYLFPEDDNGNATALLHLDAYRLTGPDDLLSVGYDDELRADAVTVIEWASLIEDALGDDGLRIRMEHVGESHRRLELSPQGDWSVRLESLRG